MDYSKTIIYKLVCNDVSITDCYVGHTTNFNTKKSNHKKECNNCDNPKYNQYIYEFIRKHGEFDNWSMILIEKYPCKDVNEALKRERYWIETLKPTMFIRTQKQTKKEYRDTHKNEIKEYYQINKEHICELSKSYYEKNKVAICNKRREKRNEKKEQELKSWLTSASEKLSVV